MTDQKAATKFCPSCEVDLCAGCSSILHVQALANHQVVELERKAVVMGHSECE